MRIAHLLLFFVLCCIGFSCQDDPIIEEEIVEQLPVLPDVFVDGALTGIVLNEDGMPLSGVSVKAADFILTTSEEGLFNSGTQKMAYQGTGLRVTHPDYFPAYAMAFPELGYNRFFQIQLRKVPSQSAILSDLSIELNLDQNGKLKIQKNDLIAAGNGVPYTGSIEYQSQYFEPNEDHGPDNFIGIGSFSQPLALDILTGMAFYLKGNNGESLEVAADKKLLLQLPLNSIGSVPPKADLWHLDASGNYWVKKGEAQLVGNHYEGEVDANGYWCVAKSTETEIVVGQITFEGKALPNYEVQLFANGQKIGRCRSNEAGQFRVYAPENEMVQLEIGECNGASLVQIDQFVGENTVDIGAVALETTGLQQSNIQGQLVNCACQTIDEGMIILESAGQWSFFPVDLTNGSFQLDFLSCTNDAYQLIALNRANKNTSHPVHFTARGQYRRRAGFYLR